MMYKVWSIQWTQGGKYAHVVLSLTTKHPEHIVFYICKPSMLLPELYWTNVLDACPTNCPLRTKFVNIGSYKILEFTILTVLFKSFHASFKTKINFYCQCYKMNILNFTKMEYFEYLRNIIFWILNKWGTKIWFRRSLYSSLYGLL